VRDGWALRKLGEICDFEGGSQPPKSEFVYRQKPNYVRFLQIRDFKGDENVTYVAKSKKNRLCGENDILIGRYGASVGKILTGKAGSYNVALVKATPNENLLDRSWFYNYLTSQEFQNRLLNVAARSAQNGFSKEDIYGFPVPVPPMREQKRIVCILDEAFDSIARAKVNTQKNLQNARALFESHRESVFTQNDKGWVKKKLSAICEFVNGRAYKKDEMLSAGKYPLLRVGNFFTNRDWFYSDLELEPKKYCDTGDLLYAWSASFGPRIWDGGKVIYHYHIWKVLPKAGIVDKQFLLHLLAWDVERIKQAHGTGTTMMHVSKGSMDNRILPVPPLKETSEPCSNVG
jgi:type I restriction enzyme, S subunit